MSLNPKQLRFIEEYLIDLNATRAYRRAYPNCKTDGAAEVAGHRLLRNVKVQSEIQKQQNERAKRVEVTLDMVVRELARIAFGNRRKLFSWGPDGVKFTKSEDLDEDIAAIVEEVSQTITDSGGTMRVKTASKTEALRLLGMHLGGHVERHEHSGPGGKPIAVADDRRTARIIELIELARARGAAFATGGGNGEPATMEPATGAAENGVPEPS